MQRESKFRHVINHKRLLKRIALGVVSAVMISTHVPVSHAITHQLVTPSQATNVLNEQAELLRQIRLERELNQGLVGFEGDYALPEVPTDIGVIVVFETPPVQVQLVEALYEGISLTESEAISNVDASQEKFLSQLTDELNLQPVDFDIIESYTYAINGISIVIGSDKIDDLVELDTVRAVFPDENVTISPIDEVALEAAVAAHVETHNPPGMRPGRARMRADELHALGYRGEGVLVAVVDTGVEYRHPAFLGAFPSLEDMHERGASHINQDSLSWIGWVGAPGNADDRNPTLDPDFNGHFPGVPYGVPTPNLNFQYRNAPTWYGNYRFLGRNLMEGFHTILPEHDFGHYYPMETFPNTPTPAHFTGNTQSSHGTHVAGTIVGRDTGRTNSILGVAPEAQMIAYRVLGPGGGSVTTVLRGIEWSYIDRADVSNLSLGGGSATTNALTGTAINNLMLSQNHQITFVLSAGNSGAGLNGFYTTTDPAPATKAITVAAFQDSGVAEELPRLANFSSRGPILMSYEIKPDIGAHGVNVHSANTRWHSSGYSSSSGTSMSAPHVAGAAALLVQHSRDNGEQFTNEEIKVRMMNTAIRLDVGHFTSNTHTEANIRGSVFDTGAGQVDVYAAAFADTFVYVTYDRVVLDPRTASLLDPFNDQDFLNSDAFTTTRTGSFSFGGVNRLLPGQREIALDRTLTATLINHQATEVTYTFEVEWINYDHHRNQNAAENGVTVNLSTPSLVVAAGEAASFNATMIIPNTAALGHYEGFINVLANGEIVAVMPFAGVVAESNPVLHSISLYRPVISTSDARESEVSSELGWFFTPQNGFATRAWIFEATEGLTRSNWMNEEFADAFVGFAGANELPAAGGANAIFSPAIAASNPGTRLTTGQQHRGVLFDGTYLNASQIFDLHDETRSVNNPALLSDLNFVNRQTPETSWNQLDEGDFVIILEVYEAAFHNDWVWAFDTLLEFAVDNTGAQINALVDGEKVVFEETVVVTTPEVTLTGNVFDEWLNQAIENGVTFDIWNDESRNQLSVENNLALFIQINDQEQTPVTIDSNGNFQVDLTDLEEETAITLTVIDGYSAVPTTDRLFSTIPVNRLPFLNIPGVGTAINNLPGARGVLPRTIEGLRAVDTSYEGMLNLAARLAYAPGLAGAANAAARNAHVWSGLNVSELTFTIQVTEAPGLMISRIDGGVWADGYVGDVNNLAGRRDYVGTELGIVAQTPEGYIFSHWEQVYGQVEVEFLPNRYAPEATFVVPNSYVTVRAVFIEDETPVYVPTLVSSVPAAFVTQIPGNENYLTVTVTQTFSDGTTNVIENTVRIRNNSEATVTVGDYRVFVRTQGNTQIREIRFVD